jgi:hypothetical protein
MNSTLRDNSSKRDDTSAYQFSRAAEDQLDFEENLARRSDDVRRVDAAFLGGSSLLTLLWAALFTGVAGGVLAVGSTLLGGHP